MFVIAGHVFDVPAEHAFVSVESDRLGKNGKAAEFSYLGAKKFIVPLFFVSGFLNMAFDDEVIGGVKMHTGRDGAGVRIQMLGVDEPTWFRFCLQQKSEGIGLISFFYYEFPAYRILLRFSSEKEGQER